MKPRQRPRAAESSLRQSQSPAVGSNGISDPSATTAAIAVSAAATAACVSASKQQQLLTQQQQLLQLQHQQQLQSQQKQQESLLLPSDQPSWSDEKHATQPQNDMSSLIDLDPESTLLANLDPLASSVSTNPVVPFVAAQPFQPAFGSNMPRADPFVSSSNGHFNSLSGQSVRPAVTFAAYPSGVMPHHWLSYSMHGCAQPVIGHRPAVPYSPLRMMTPQYPSVVAQGKTGSNNDLLLLQVSKYLLVTHLARDFNHVISNAFYMV